MRLGFHPIYLIAVFTLSGTITCLVLTCLVSGWLKRSLLILVALILLAPSGLVLMIHMPELVDARYRSYKRFYNDIQPGMTRSEVMELVDRHYPLDGKRLRPKVMEDSEIKLGFFMNPEGEHGPSCEGIFMTMQEDRVVKKHYSKD